MRNYQSRPIGSKSFPEVNAMLSQTCGSRQGQGRGHGRNPRFMLVIPQILIKKMSHYTTRN